MMISVIVLSIYLLMVRGLFLLTSKERERNVKHTQKNQVKIVRCFERTMASTVQHVSFHCQSFQMCLYLRQAKFDVVRTFSGNRGKADGLKMHDSCRPLHFISSWVKTTAVFLS